MIGVIQALKSMNNPLFKYWHYLKEGERNCVYLYFMCEWKMKEIGTHYGWACHNSSCSRVSQLVSRGLKSLKRLIDIHEPENDLNDRLIPVRIEDERFTNSN